MTNIAAEAKARYAYVADQLKRRLPTGDVVELGAAPGDQIVALAQAGYRCTAVDIGIASDGWADAEEGRMVQLFTDNDVTFVQANLEEVPYPLDDATFDAVIMTEVYEHLRDYPIRALQESFRILRPGGYLFFTTPNAAYVVSRIKLLAGRSPATPLHDWIGGLPFARHAREYTFGEAHELMGKAGFVVEVSESRDFFPPAQNPVKRLGKSAIALSARYRPTLGPSIAIVARKPVA